MMSVTFQSKKLKAKRIPKTFDAIMLQKVGKYACSKNFYGAPCTFVGNYAAFGKIAALIFAFSPNIQN